MNKDFQELLLGLKNADARFLVVGAYALAVHGRPRATGDLDVWVEATQENAIKVFEVLEQFGAPLGELKISDLASPGIVFQMGQPPRRIDILTSASGVQFDDAWQQRTSAKFGEVECPVIGFDALLSNKQATGRPKDLADVEELKKIQKRRL